MEDKMLCEEVCEKTCCCGKVNAGTTKADFVVDKLNNLLNQVWALEEAGIIHIYGSEDECKFKMLRSYQGLLNELYNNVK